jgi:hypothetical protein
MEASKVDRKSKRASFHIEPPASWLQLLVWAFLSTIIGVVVSLIALLLPYPHTQTTFFLPGGLSRTSIYWYWYDIFSAAAISVSAFIIGLRGRSIAMLIIFVLFSTTGITLVIAALEYGTSIYVTYVPTATIALVVGVLTFYRSMIVDLSRENWGRFFPVQHSRTSRGKADGGSEGDSRVRGTREKDDNR